MFCQLHRLSSGPEGEEREWGEGGGTMNDITLNYSVSVYVFIFDLTTIIIKKKASDLFH